MGIIKSLSALKAKIQEDLKQALKARDELKISISRMLLSDIHNQEIQIHGELADDQIRAVLASAAKKHQDSIAQFQIAGRTDLVNRETGELQIIQSYLPAQLSEAELRREISGVIAGLGPEGPRDFGKVMQAVMAKLKGRAAGQLVSQIVKEELGKNS